MSLKIDYISALCQMCIPQACASVITSSVSRNVGQSPCIKQYTYMWHTCKSSGNLYLLVLHARVILGSEWLGTFIVQDAMIEDAMKECLQVGEYL